MPVEFQAESTGGDERIRHYRRPGQRDETLVEEFSVAEFVGNTLLHYDGEIAEGEQGVYRMEANVNVPPVSLSAEERY